MAAESAVSSGNGSLEKRNLVWLVVTGLAASMGSFPVSGAVFQAYLLESGLSNAQIGTVGSAVAIAGAVGMFGLMGIANSVRRRIRVVTGFKLLACLMPFALAGLTLLDATGIGPAMVFATVVVVMGLGTAIQSFASLVYYSAFVRCISRRMRGRLTGTSGVVTGLATIGLGIGITVLLERTSFPWGFTLCFFAAGGFVVISAISFSRVVELPALEHPADESTRSPLAAIWKVLKLREFRVLLAPNLLRGLASGVSYFVLAMGWERLGLSQEHGAALGTVTAAAGMLGMVTIGLLHDRWGAGWICLLGDVIAAIGLLGLVLTGSPNWFLVFNGVLAFGGIMEGAGVPLGTYDVAPPSMIAAYNGLRLLLLNGMGALSTLCVGMLLDRIDPLPIFVAGAGLTLVNGYLYWFGFRRASRQTDLEEGS